jgi:hypothetical protein
MNKYVNEIDTEVEKIENEKDDATNITVSIL